MKMAPKLAATGTWLLCRSSVAFVSRGGLGRSSSVTKELAASHSSLMPSRRKFFTRFFSSKNGIEADINSGVSRLKTLQKMLSSYGAPGSTGCSSPGDLETVYISMIDNDDPVEESPELIVAMTASLNKYANLHPLLLPLAESKSSGNFICALRRAHAVDEDNSSPPPSWPIVEAKSRGIGMRLLALSSEHLMRRIACECDFTGERTELIGLYNQDLDRTKIKDGGLDQPYEKGSVEKLGYGVDKYILLRVGPFLDIYKNLALGHAERSDESSALITAEVANCKINGFASTFLFYASLLNSFPNRLEETRDAARMCLRMPLPSIGLTIEEFREAAVLGQIADETDSDEEVYAKLQLMYEKMRKHENSEGPQLGNNHDMTEEQKAIEEANYLIDTVALTGADWKGIRPKLAAIYKSAGQEDIARFVNPKNTP